MGKQITVISILQQNWRRAVLLGVAASVSSLMVGVVFQTAFYEIASNIPALVRQDAHVTIPLCNVFPDLYGCEAWTGLLTSLEIWELSLKVAQIGGLLANLVLVTIFSIWVTVRTRSEDLWPGALLGVAGFVSSLMLAFVIHLPLSIHTAFGLFEILLLLLLPLCGFTGGQIGSIRLSRQPSHKPVHFLPHMGGEQIDGTGESLSERELEVLVLVAEGCKNHEIAQRLFISNATVKTHLQHIFAKLGVSNRTAAVTQALANELLRQEAAAGEDDA